jgi:hypothetical protein
VLGIEGERVKADSKRESTVSVRIEREFLIDNLPVLIHFIIVMT